MIESSNSELITGTGRQNVVEVCCSRCCPTAEEANGGLVIQSINGNNVRSRSCRSSSSFDQAIRLSRANPAQILAKERHSCHR
ncbi:hypothetical protein PAHAL_6G230700 [Panicum hallii]|uniref:Uncharacterized protein n=1 Tax=Panicum hallii TaxID=206008 RepID=A0A2T8IHB8_9POAL|nr:hypothetical protein PAHAL_6G230700 [Panicum hallii]